MPIGVASQVLRSESQQRGRWLRSALLEVHKSAGKLDQSLVEVEVGTQAILEPEVFQDLMRLEETLLIEQSKETQVPRIEGAMVQIGCPLRDFLRLVRHGAV